MVKHLLGRQEELTLSPGIHKKNPGLMVEACEHCSREIDHRSSLAYQCDLLGKLQTSERPCLEKKNSQGGHI